MSLARNDSFPPPGISVDSDLNSSLLQSVSKPSASPDQETFGGFTEAELDEHIDTMVNRFVPPPPECRSGILQLLNRRRVAALIVSNYDGAELQDKCRDIYTYTMKLEMERMGQDRHIDELFQRWQQLHRDEEEINGRWDARMSEFSQEDQEKYDELTERHRQEVAAFEAQWKDPNYLRPFTKPSARLLQLREQEKAMAVSRLYQQAKDMKQFADKVQRDETAAAQERIALQMGIDREKLLKRQENDRVRHMNHRKTHLWEMDKERNEELRPILSAISQIRAKRGGPANRTPVLIISKPGAPDQTLTPRTQQHYAAYRAERKLAKLEVQPVEQPEKKPARPRGEGRKTDLSGAVEGSAETAEKQPESPPQGEAGPLPDVIGAVIGDDVESGLTASQ
jgi:hypothetical protein